VIGTYASAILICVAAVLLGRAVCVLAGHRGSTWLGPSLGFAALMVICEVAIRLPGRGWTAVGALLAFVALAIWIGARRRADWPSLLDALPVVAVLLIALSIPFIANDRVGVLGISFLNDTHWHLLLAEGLRRPAIQHLDTFGPGYPIGPHAVAATFAQLLGSDVDKTVTGLLIAVPLLTGTTALGLLGGMSRRLRWLVAILCAIPYLAVAWYVQSAFKEPILALLLLGLVLALQLGRRDSFRRPLAVLFPGAVLVAGVIYAYSYPGLVWPAGVVACWLLFELVLGGGWRRGRPLMSDLRRVLPEVAVGVGLLVLLILPDVGRMHTFWLSNGGASIGLVGGVTKDALANLVAPLRALEGLNVWLIGDFRFAPFDALQGGAFAGFAAVVLVFALVTALQRRELVWPAAIVAFALIYAYTRHSQSPYVAAKALAIPAPLVMLGAGGALMGQLDRANWRSAVTLGFALATVVFFGLAFQSSFLVLRDAQVGPTNHIDELRSLRPLLHNRPTLVLFYDDYFKWGLLGVPASSPVLQSPIPAWVQPAKPWLYGQPLDFDSVDARTLNRFDYVITTRTRAQSEAPPNFQLVGQSHSYEVWKRVGQTRPRLVLSESGHPGAIFDCATRAGRRVAREHGIARVRPAPVYIKVSPLAPGNSERLSVNLPAGEWELSIPFVSQQAVTVRGAGLDVRLPPNLDRPGEIWPVGVVQSSGAPIELTLTMANPGLISSGTPATQFFAPQPMVAVPTVPARTVPLRAACRRYVDWYQLG
jgi:hypothetical protein